MSYKQEAWWPNKLCCNLNSRTRNITFGAHNWTTHNSTPNTHVKQERCETNGMSWENDWRPELWWKIFEKMNKDRTFYCFGVQSGPKNWTSEAYILHTSKKYLQWACEAILMWNQWKPFEKVTKHQNFELFGAQTGTEIGPLRSILYTYLKVAPIGISNKIDANPKETF